MNADELNAPFTKVAPKDIKELLCIWNTSGYMKDCLGEYYWNELLDIINGKITKEMLIKRLEEEDE